MIIPKGTHVFWPLNEFGANAPTKEGYIMGGPFDPPAPGDPKKKIIKGPYYHIGSRPDSHRVTHWVEASKLKGVDQNKKRQRDEEDDD